MWKNGRMLARFLLVCLAAIAAGASHGEDDMDFSHVDSLDKAMALAEEGKLFKILLFPAEFGGQDVPPNVVYVPAGIPEIKDQITGTLIRFVNEGLIDNLVVNPEYKGNSFVPSRIVMQTSQSGDDRIPVLPDTPMRR